MKIGLLNECFPPIQDGVAQLVENYAKLFHQRGHEVTVATAKNPFVRYNNPYRVINFPSIPLVFCPPYRAGLPVWSFAQWHPIRKFRADIYHAHSPFTSGNLALHLGKKYHTPVVMTFHSKFKDDFKRFVPNERLVQKMVDTIMATYNAADEVWIPQEAVLDVLREYGYKGKVEVVPNAIDYDYGMESLPARRQTAREKLGLSAHQLCYLFVGQMSWKKNLDLILDAVSLLKDIDYTLFLVGGGDSTNEVLRKISQLGLEAHVQLIPPIQSREELSTYYAAADLFLFPSRYDTFSLVIREAAAHGVPSLILEDTTIAAALKQDHNVFMGAGTPQQYADGIRFLSSRSDLRREVGRTARQEICRTWNEIIPEVEDRYRHIIARYS